MENAEINNIIKIVGLQYKKSYDDAESLKSLRYGKIMIMTDQVRCVVNVCYGLFYLRADASRMGMCDHDGDYIYLCVFVLRIKMAPTLRACSSTSSTITGHLF